MFTQREKKKVEKRKNKFEKKKGNGEKSFADMIKLDIEAEE